jgi:hypothetical protein
LKLKTTARLRPNDLCFTDTSSIVLILRRDDSTSVSLSADPPNRPGKDKAGHAGEDRNIERHYLKRHRNHKQDAKCTQQNRNLL